MFSLCVACHAQVITDAVELHSLTRAETVAPKQVKIRGVVTYKRGDEFSDFAMQDASGGFIADGQLHLPEIKGVKLGQEIEIEGYTVIEPPPAPRVSVTKYSLGPVVGLPEPLPLTPQALLGGAGLFSYVEFSAVIRSTRIERELLPHRLILELGPPEQRFSVRLARYEEETLRYLKPDARVRIRGTALAWTSVNLQPYSVFIGVNEPSEIELLSPAQDPAEVELVSIDKLVSEPTEGFDARWQRVRGTVTLCWSGELVVIQGEQGAIRITPSDTQDLKPGDVVEASGFATAERGRIYLDEAVFGEPVKGKLPPAEVVEARRIKPEASTADREGYLVTVSAELKEISKRRQAVTLRMESDGTAFDALLPPGSVLPEYLRPSSKLELTGVCRFILGEEARRQAIRLDGFEIQLNGIESIRVISAAPWWTFQRLGIAIAIVLAGLGLSLIWVAALKKRVAERSALLVREIRARHDNQLLTSERSRLAADLHDTLSQTLSGAAFQMEIAHSLDGTPQAEDHQDLARRLIDRSREDLRRAVWDLTPSAMVEKNLETALRETADELSAENACKVTVSAQAEIPRLPSRIGSHLFRIGQEAMHNAVRHGKPAKVRVTLGHTDGILTLRVEDDGEGFETKAAPGPPQGHFGLTSMRDRVHRMGGEFHIESSPQGTRITASVPISTEP